MITNKSMGSSFERTFADYLYRNGFWVHLMAQTAIGQPADIIAVKEGRSYLIDCKNCINGYFDKNRVEDNQKLSMHLWEECGNGSGWFAVRIGQIVWMCELWRFEMTDRVRLNMDWFRENTVTLEKWIEEGH